MTKDNFEAAKLLIKDIEYLKNLLDRTRRGSNIELNIICIGVPNVQLNPSIASIYLGISQETMLKMIIANIENGILEKEKQLEQL